jgi:hypothetical protein
MEILEKVQVEGPGLQRRLRSPESTTVIEYLLNILLSLGPSDTFTGLEPQDVTERCLGTLDLCR